MSQPFVLSAGESLQVLSLGPGHQPTFVYRIALDTIDPECELKINRDGGPAVVISPKQKHKAIDVSASTNLYLEAVSGQKKGTISGTYECVGFAR